MPDARGQYIPDLTGVSKIEKELASVLGETADGINHAECFDVEQRSEIYTILKTLRAETENHSQAIGRWVNDGGGESADA